MTTITGCFRPGPSRLAAALALALALAAPAVSAQSTAAAIHGRVTIDAVPAEGARVRATNVDTGLARSVQAGRGGEYSLAGLPPGSYRVEVDDDGGNAGMRTVTVRVGETATLNLATGGRAETAPAGGATEMEAVVVTAQALPETRTSEVASYISQKQIQALPQVSRNFLAFADTVPGMQFVNSGESGYSSLRSGAQSSNGINVYIDGVGQKNYVTKGGLSGQDSSRGNPFPQLAIGEYKVITSNYKAEYDQISSAAVTAVTRSGTNEFEGSFFWDRTSDQWRAPTPREEAEGTKVPSREEQYGVAFAGPILRDRLHFFVTYEAKDFLQPREVRIGENVTVDRLPPHLRPLVGNNQATFNEDLYFGKLSWQATDTQLLELTAKRREEDGLLLDSGVDTASRAKTDNNQETRIDLRWQAGAGDWLNDAHLTWEESRWNPRSNVHEPGYLLYTWPQGDDGNPQERLVLAAGGGADYQDKGQEGHGLQNDFSWFGWEGHTIKAGVKFKRVEVSAFEQQPWNPQFRYDIAGDPAVPYQVDFNASTLTGDRRAGSVNRQLGIYLQDDWELNERLTLNLGLRWDYEETPGFLDHVTDPGIAAALRGWANIRDTDYDIERYISNGRNRSAFKDAWQPRLGFSWDLFADGRHVVFGGAGRAYDRNLFDYLALEQSKHTFPSYSYRFDIPGHPCEPGEGNCLAWDPAYMDPEALEGLAAADPNLGTEVNLIRNDLRTPYSDQFSLGMRNVVTLGNHDWETSATYAHIRSYDGIYFALGNRWPGGSFRDPARPDATWGGQPWDFPIPGYGNLVIAQNGIQTRLDSLLLSIAKPYTRASGWGATIAYTYSDARENRLNAANSDEHYLFDHPGLAGQPMLASVGIARHRLVATGIRDLPGGLTLSAKLTVASPLVRDAVNCFDVSGTDYCHFDPYTPDDDGFRQLDIALQKAWDTGTDLRPWVRFDLVNAFDWRNWTDYDNHRGDPGAGNPDWGRRNGNGILLPTRTFKLSMGFDW
ncbi:TonB-dependent receptor [Lysobacter sp. GX 14042]|uniref:TonB-dependent receptor n=1 Tax=Lysobacter sp. GX 14042 TaxID=2907155 RepID=UPI001F3A4D18|nr:TonB-dependent receptor [Lysobacter sp. GX 14042]MCE7031240.1 TonB-dependent receptor [Lysobacter sp. GX 14042]